MLKGTIILAIDNQMSVNFEQNDVSYTYVNTAGRPQYQIQKLHFAMNNPVEQTFAKFNKSTFMFQRQIFYTTIFYFLVFHMYCHETVYSLDRNVQKHPT